MPVGMAFLISKLLIFFFPLLFSVTILANPLLSCENNSHEAYGYTCNGLTNPSEKNCATFAVLRTNSFFSSLSNLTMYLGLNRKAVAEANGFSPETEFLPNDQPLLIPVECRCFETGFYQADVTKITALGESFEGIALSLEGLTTCKAMRVKNPFVEPWNLRENVKLLVPLRCACPSSTEMSSGTKVLISVPIRPGDSVASLATQFNASPEAILRVNKRSEKEIISDALAVLIPLSQKPLLGSLAKPSEPGSGFPQRSVRADDRRRKKKLRKQKLAICMTVVSVAILASALAAATFFFIRWRKEKQQVILSSKMVDVELQQLSLSIRTTSEKKVSFEGSQSTLDGQIIDGLPLTPRASKPLLECYTFEEIKKATEDFDSHNLIEGTVYHARLKGKNVAIKCTTSEYISKVDFSLFQDAIHNHPNIMRIVGSCVTDGPDSFLVFEYAKNGTLKDWVHGGLAVKSHFIASCSCFLTWKQRLRICLDVALALQYMHHIMHPVYVHRNIKGRNIFLDEEFNAKVGNFGMAKCVEDDAEDNPDFCSRNPASWSKGYLAPEYVNHSVVSPSMDIFAYGVVLLEVLSGETPVKPCEKQEEILMLSEKIKSILKSDKPDDLRVWIDADLGENYSFDSAVALANLARACLEDDPSMRPSAGEIVQKLSRLVEESPDSNQQQFLMNESSSKPLVLAAASNNS